MLLALNMVSERRAESNVLLHGSGFLQKPTAPGDYIQITNEDVNGYMSVLHGMDYDRTLTLILHTPGGNVNAAESLVEYLRSKFRRIEVIVPTFALSAGTMITLASDLIIMGRQSQLGPIDPQMIYSGRYVSAQAIVDQFKLAKKEIEENISSAHVWAPILASLGPSLILESQNALQYGEEMVSRWLEKFMFSGIEEESVRRTKAKKVARYFNDATRHKSHGRRINRDEARGLEVLVDDLEKDQLLQDGVLTIYHLMTIMFETGPAAKVLWSSHDHTWIKNWTLAAS